QPRRRQHESNHDNERNHNTETTTSRRSRVIIILPLLMIFRRFQSCPTVLPRCTPNQLDPVSQKDSVCQRPRQRPRLRPQQTPANGVSLARPAPGTHRERNQPSPYNQGRERDYGDDTTTLATTSATTTTRAAQHDESGEHDDESSGDDDNDQSDDDNDQSDDDNDQSDDDNDDERNDDERNDDERNDDERNDDDDASAPSPSSAASVLATCSRPKATKTTTETTSGNDTPASVNMSNEHAKSTVHSQSPVGLFQAKYRLTRAGVILPTSRSRQATTVPPFLLDSQASTSPAMLYSPVTCSASLSQSAKSTSA
ncbi:hypothetical protein OJAV_G00131990, partial [Oryzias javanicus]